MYVAKDRLMCSRACREVPSRTSSRCWGFARGGWKDRMYMLTIKKAKQINSTTNLDQLSIDKSGGIKNRMEEIADDSSRRCEQKRERPLR